MATDAHKAKSFSYNNLNEAEYDDLVQYIQCSEIAFGLNNEVEYVV